MVFRAQEPKGRLLVLFLRVASGHSFEGMGRIPIRSPDVGPQAMVFEQHSILQRKLAEDARKKQAEEEEEKRKRAAEEKEQQKTQKTQPKDPKDSKDPKAESCCFRSAALLEPCRIRRRRKKMRQRGRREQRS